MVAEYFVFGMVAGVVMVVAGLWPKLSTWIAGELHRRWLHRR
jgi:hypothetical protein